MLSRTVLTGRRLVNTFLLDSPDGSLALCTTPIILHQLSMAAAVAILFLSSVSVCPDGILSKHYIWRVETARWHSGTSPTRHAPTQYGGGG